MNTTTLFLSQMMGPIMVVLGFAIMARPKFYEQSYKQLDKDPLVVILLSVLTLAMSIAIVL